MKIERSLSKGYVNAAILLGSKSEKYPVVISEAIILGKPYISTHAGVVPYLKGGRLLEA